MSNVVNLDDYRECELLGSVNVFRQPNGEILLGITYMDPRKIEAFETVSERFYHFAELVEAGLSSLQEQGAEFERDGH